MRYLYSQAYQYHRNPRFRDVASEYPLHSFEFYMGDELDSGVCDSCGGSLRSRLKYMQESTWWDLPDLLGVTVEERMRLK